MNFLCGTNLLLFMCSRFLIKNEIWTTKLLRLFVCVVKQYHNRIYQSGIKRGIK